MEEEEEEVLTEKKTPNAHMYCTKKPRRSHWDPSQKSTCFGSGRYGIGSVDTSNPSGSLPPADFFARSPPTCRPFLLYQS
jgi:hypothetical protein